MRIAEFAKKELKELLSDRVFLISVLLQFTIVSGLLFLYTFYSSISNTTFPLTVELDAYDPGLVDRLTETGVTVRVAEGGQLKTFNAKERPDVRTRPLVVKFNSSSNEVSTDVSNIFSGYAISKIRDAAEEVSFEQALEDRNFLYEYSDIKEGDYSFMPLSYGIVVPITIILPAFIMMGFTLQGILVDRKTKVIELLLVSPISDFQIAQIKVLPYLLVSAVLSAMWILYISTRVEILNFWLLVGISALFSMLTVSISTIISSTASSVKEANAYSSLAGIAIPMLGILPYSPISIYFPTAIMARVSSSVLNFEIVASVLVFASVSLLAFYGAILSIRRMRVNFA